MSSFPVFWYLILMGSLFHMKITASVTKSLHQDCGTCYLHWPIFFPYTYTLLFCCKIKCSCAGLHRLHASYDHECNMYKGTLRIHENPCTVLIPLCSNYLNLPICLSFFCPAFGWVYHVLLPVRAINCENCQLSTGAINLSELRTTFHPPTQTIMIQENKKNHNHCIFIFQHSSPNSLEP